jgi:branched-chain amino acid transport system permease protein
MTIFSQLLVDGIATGAIYALIAVGFALLWQTSGTINFAQGEFVMVPGFIMLGLMDFFDIGLMPAFILTLPITLFFFGYLFKRLLVDPLIRYGDFPLVIATIGLGILLKEPNWLQEPEAYSFPSCSPIKSWILRASVFQPTIWLCWALPL